MQEPTFEIQTMRVAMLMTPERGCSLLKYYKLKKNGKMGAN